MAARVNGRPVYLSDYERELTRYQASLVAQGTDPNNPEGEEALAQARSWILDVMIEEKLIEQAAEEAGVIVSEEAVDEEMSAMIEESGGEEAFLARLAEWQYTREEFREKTRQGLIGREMTDYVTEKVPQKAEHVHARHILVDTLEEARGLHAQLEAGADFAALAKAHSQDTSTRETGGDLGFFPQGILMAPEVEEAAFELQPGQFSDVITSELGYHIVQVVERDPDRTLNPENLRLLREQAVQTWLQGLWAQAEIKRFVEATP